jgi:hypothetical protein
MGIACQLTGVFCAGEARSRRLVGSDFFRACKIPLVVSVPCQKLTGRAAFMIWIILNSILLGFFGGLHQAGVVPSLLELNFSAKQPAVVVFYHTIYAASFFDPFTIS